MGLGRGFFIDLGTGVKVRKYSMTYLTLLYSKSLISAQAKESASFFTLWIPWSRKNYFIEAYPGNQTFRESIQSCSHCQ